MNLACPNCGTIYRINPARVPENGAFTRCRECDTGLRIEHPGDREPAGAVVTAQAAELPGPTPATPEPPQPEQAGEQAAEATAEPPLEPEPEPQRSVPVFGPQDPETRAKRLARALVSDIVVYNPERRKESLDRGTLRQDFRDEILKSWEEYVEQVGEDMAKKSPYFRDALNDILAEGKRVF